MTGLQSRANYLLVNPQKAFEHAPQEQAAREVDGCTEHEEVLTCHVPGMRSIGQRKMPVRLHSKYATASFMWSIRSAGLQGRAGRATSNLHTCRIPPGQVVFHARFVNVIALDHFVLDFLGIDADKRLCSNPVQVNNTKDELGSLGYQGSQTHGFMNSLLTLGNVHAVGPHWGKLPMAGQIRAPKYSCKLHASFQE